MSQGYPHIVSRVNGMKIPLLPGQAGILHRFDHPENRLVVASTSYDPINDARDDAAALIIPSSSAPEAASASPTAKPVTDEVAELRAQLAAQAEQLAAAQAAAKPAKIGKAKTVEPAPVEGGVL